MSTSLTKHGIRDLMRRERSTLDAGWVSATSALLSDRVIGLPEFKKAAVVCCYLSLPGEVETRTIMAAAWKLGKRVALPMPRVDGEYMPAWFTPDEPMTRGSFGLMQAVTPHWAKPERFELILVPGLAFSKTGSRLGHGRGYYDRMLARLAKRLDCRTGLCFNSQIRPEWPVSAEDVGMDLIVTESTVYRIT